MDNQYLDFCYPAEPSTQLKDLNSVKGGLKHIGLCVANLATIESTINKMGLIAHSCADYEHGRRFYFREDDGARLQIVSYNAD